MKGSLEHDVSVAGKQRLGDFLLEQVIGEGGSGHVYAARWGHRRVALKVLHKSLLTSAGERERFLDEARKLADIHHPAVVKILGFGQFDDERPYLVMELLEGESLAHRLVRKKMALAHTLSVFEQLTEALSALHQQGLVHRDIKPENIFLVRDGQYAVLLDFGIAKAEDAPMSTVTREGGIRGTPAYMAPERFFGHAASVRSDIYELGVVLYAMLVGRLPWDDACDPVGRLNPKRPSELGVELSGDLEVEVLQALSTRAEVRPSSVEEFAQRIKRAVAGVKIPRRRTADMPITHQAVVSETGPTQTVAAVDKGAAPSASGGPAQAVERRVGGQAQAQVQAQDETNAHVDVGTAPTGRVDTPGHVDHRDPAAPAGPSHDDIESASVGAQSASTAGERVTGPTPGAQEALRARSRGDVTTEPLKEATPSSAHSGDAHARHFTFGFWHKVVFAAGTGLLIGLLIVGAVVYWPGEETAVERKARDAIRNAKHGTAESNSADGASRSAEGNGQNSAWSGKGRHARFLPLNAENRPTLDATSFTPRKLLRYYPKDTQLMIWVSYDRLRSTKAYKKAAADFNEQRITLALKMVETMCSLSFEKQLQWIGFGVSGKASGEAADVAIRGRWSRERLEQCIQSLGAMSEKKITLKRQGALTRAVFGTRKIWLAWPDPHTVMFSTRPIAQHEWWKKRLRGIDSCMEDAEMRHLVDALDSDSVAWVTSLAPKWVAEKLFKGAIKKPQGVYTTLSVAKDTLIKGGLHYGTAADARGAQKGLRRWLKDLRKDTAGKMIFNKVKITTVNDSILAVLRLDEKMTMLFADAVREAIEEAGNKVEKSTK
jgi:serine/threonine protein kinase